MDAAAAAAHEEPAGDLRTRLHQFAHRDDEPEPDEDTKFEPALLLRPEPEAEPSPSPAPFAQTGHASPGAPAQLATSASNPTAAMSTATCASAAAGGSSANDEPLQVTAQVQHAGTKRAAASSACEDRASAASDCCKVARVENFCGGRVESSGNGSAGGSDGGIGALAMAAVDDLEGERYREDEKDRGADDASPSKATSPAHQPQTSAST